MFQRLTAEGVDDRGGEKKVAARLGSLLEMIESNPNHIEWMEKIAAISLKGCINQPENGLSEILAWKSINDAGSIAEKLEASRQLLVFREIQAFVRENNDATKKGTALEVEAGNILYREIHKKLIKEDLVEKGSWFGVPENIRYERSAGFATSELTEKIFAKARKVFDLSQDELTNQMLELNGEIWASVVFPKEVAELNIKQANFKEALSDLAETLLKKHKVDIFKPNKNREDLETESQALAQIPTDQSSPLDDAAKKLINDYLAIGSSEKSDENFIEAKKQFLNATGRELEEKATMARELTEARLAEEKLAKEPLSKKDQLSQSGAAEEKEEQQRQEFKSDESEEEEKKQGFEPDEPKQKETPTQATNPLNQNRAAEEEREEENQKPTNTAAVSQGCFPALSSFLPSFRRSNKASSGQDANTLKPSTTTRPCSSSKMAASTENQLDRK